MCRLRAVREVPSSRRSVTVGGPRPTWPTARTSNLPRMGTLRLDHLVVGATDEWTSATFLAEMFDLRAPESYGPFAAVDVGSTQILFGSKQKFPGEFRHHLSFVVTDDEFDSIMDRLRDRGIQFFADPFGEKPGEINDRTGRGVYFRDPDGHSWEAMTQTDRGLL